MESSLFVVLLTGNLYNRYVWAFHGGSVWIILQKPMQQVDRIDNAPLNKT